MRLKDKSNEIILQKQCYYTEKRKQLLKKAVILCVENHSIIKN